MSLEQWLTGLFLVFSLGSFLLLFVLSIKTYIGKYIVLIALGIKDLRYLENQDRVENRGRSFILSLYVIWLVVLLLVCLLAISNKDFLSLILSAICMGFGLVISILDIYLETNSIPKAWGDYK